MASRLCRKLFAKTCSSKQTQITRFLFSPAYSLDTVWEDRKKSKTLMDVNPYEFLTTLVVRAQDGQLTSAIDIDIASQVISATEHLSDIEELLYRFRHSKNSTSMLNSTHHALVRAFLKFDQQDKIMSFLSDSINYGIFPDWHAANLLMDKFIEQGNNRDAAKVACFMMQQEDFSVKSTRWLMLYSCLRWLNDPKPEEWSPKVEQEDDGEEIIFRLPFLKNRHFDDHFDLEESDQLIGKTLRWTTEHCLKLDDDQRTKNLMLNIKLLGLLLSKKDRQLRAAVESLARDGEFYVYKDMAEKLQDYENGKKETEKQSEESPNVSQFMEIINSMNVSDQILYEQFESVFKTDLSEFEKGDIERQNRIYEYWNSVREAKITNQITTYLKTERLKKVESELNALQKQNRHMFFFENKEELEKKLPQPPPPPPPPTLAEKRARARLSRRTLREMAKAKQVEMPKDDDYVVPELNRGSSIEQQAKY